MSEKFKFNVKAKEFVPNKKLSVKIYNKIKDPKTKVFKIKRGKKVTEIPITSYTINKCPNYQNECKKSKHGDLWKKRCSKKKSLKENTSLMKSIEKCALLRTANRRCRRSKGLDATPRHKMAAHRMYRSLEECEDMTKKYKIKKLKGGKYIINA